MVAIDKNTNMFSLYIASDRVVIHQGQHTNSMPPKLTRPSFDPTDGFHTYRFVVGKKTDIGAEALGVDEKVFGTLPEHVAAVFIDGSKIAFLYWYAGIGSADRELAGDKNNVFFGDRTDYAGSQTQLKYFAHTNAPTLPLKPVFDPNQKPATRNAKRVEIEALIDGDTQLVVTSTGIRWQSLGSAKPGRHEGRNEPTWVNGAKWMPVWAQPDEDRGVDQTQEFPLGIGFKDLKFELLAVGDHRGAEGIKPRSEVTTQQLLNSSVVTIPDEEEGSMWYRFALHKPGHQFPKASETTTQIRFNSPRVLQDFYTKSPNAWRIEDGRLIGSATGRDEKPFLTYNKYFKKISKVVIKGSVASETESERISRGKFVTHGISLGPIKRSSTNFRIGVGTINLIFNWEMADENHYRNGEDCTVQKGHALTPGKEHTIVVEQVGAGVVVSVDGKPIYTTQATLDGTVTVYPAHGSEISVSDIDIEGLGDPGRKVLGHSHTSTY